MARSPFAFHPLHFIASLLFLAFATALAEPESQVTQEQADALFAWYDQLPFPVVKDAKPVRIWLGPQFKPTKGDFEPLTELGFLIEDRGAEFRIVSGDGVPEVLTKHGEKSDEPGFVGYREIPLAEQLDALLSTLGTKDESDAWERLYAGNRGGLRRSCRLFMLARWAAQRGDSALALKALRALEIWRIAHRVEGQPESLEAQLQEEMAASLYTRALHTLCESDATRSSAVETLRRLVERCPLADSRNEKSAIETLERMIRDDGAHQPLTNQKLAGLPPEQRAEEWVFRLRDENIKGAIAGPEDERSTFPVSNGADRALAELGLAAAPALVKALDDDSFTRTQTPNGLRRVQDFALAQISSLAGCNFAGPRVSLAKYGEFTAVQRDCARAWWKGVSEKGEERYLIDSIRSGSPFINEYGAQLLKKFPDHGIPAIIEAARSGRDWESRRPMLRILINQKDQRCTDFFIDQLSHAPEVIDRFSAAVILRMHGDPRGTAAMRIEWPRLAANCAKTKWPDVADDDKYDVPSNMIAYLASAAAPEAILSLAAPNSDIPPEWRAKIIEKLASAANGNLDSEFREAGNPATKVALEDALVEFLSDTSRLERSTSPHTWFFDDTAVIEPRVCDVAALALRSWKSEKYAFDHWRSPAARARQCIICANVRAKESGEPLQPVPPEPEPLPSSVENRNRVISVEDGPAPNGEAAAFAPKLAALRDAPLDANALGSALAALAANPLPARRGFILEIFRCSDDAGISLRTSFDVGHFDSSGDVILCGALQSDDPSTLEIYGQQGQESRSQFVDPAKWEPLRKAIDKALAAPVNTGFLIVVEFTPDASQE